MEPNPLKHIDAMIPKNEHGEIIGATEKFQQLQVNIPEEEFQGLLFNLHEIEKTLVVRSMDRDVFDKIFPNFKHYRKKDTNLILRYVIYLYDVKSPLRKHYPQIEERKNVCLKLAGFAGRGLSKRIIDAVKNLTHEAIASCMHDLLKYQNNTTWAMLVSNEEVFWQYQRQINEPIKVSEPGKKAPTAAKLVAESKINLQVMEHKSKLMKECELINDRILKYEVELFGEEKEVKEEIKKLRHKSSNPESMAS